jgi:hypothetical protein
MFRLRFSHEDEVETAKALMSHWPRRVARCLQRKTSSEREAIVEIALRSRSSIIEPARPEGRRYVSARAVAPAKRKCHVGSWRGEINNQGIVIRLWPLYEPMNEQHPAYSIILLVPFRPCNKKLHATRAPFRPSPNGVGNGVGRRREKPTTSSELAANGVVYNVRVLYIPW